MWSLVPRKTTSRSACTILLDVKYVEGYCRIKIYQVKAGAKDNCVKWYFVASLENDAILDNFLNSVPIQINVGLMQSGQVVRIKDQAFASRSYLAAVKWELQPSIIANCAR